MPILSGMSQLSMSKFRVGGAAHQAGQLQQAENIYRQILARQPEHADALHMLGVIAQQAAQ